MNKLLSVCLLFLVGPAWAQTHASLRDGNACTVMDDGKTLVASAGGLVVVNKTGALDPQRALMGHRVYALVPVPQSPNRFWVGSDAGLAQVHVDAQGVRLVYRVVGPAVRDILVDGPRLWLATWGALRLGRMLTGTAAPAALLILGSPVAMLATQSLTPDLPLLACVLAGMAGVLAPVPEKGA